MRIAIYNDWWSPDLVGGAEKTALEIAKHLADCFGKDNVAIYTLSNSKLKVQEIHDNLNITRLGSNTFRSRYSTVAPIKIIEKLRILIGRSTRDLVISEMLSFMPDVILLHNVDRLGLNFASHLRSKTLIPIMRIQHDLGDTCINRTRFRKISKKNCINTCATCKIKESHYRRQSKNYNVMISVSKFLDQTFHKLMFIPLSSTYGYPSHKKIEFNSDNFHFENASSLRLGFVGRVVPEKGIEVVLNSMLLLRAFHNKKVSLTVCGAGSPKYIKSLKRLARNLGVDLNFLGYTESPFERLSGLIDAVVVPSIWQEPLGRVPLESLSRGFPCFISGIGGLVESKLFLGGPLVYFEPGNEKDLMEKIVAALEFGVPIYRATDADKNINFTLEKLVRTLFINKE